MSCYFVARILIHDEAEYSRYLETCDEVFSRFSGRYLAENEGGDGVFKLVVNNETKRVIGAQALSNYSSEFIVAVGTFIEMGMTIDEIKRIVFPHPTVGEIIREAVFQY